MAEVKSVEIYDDYPHGRKRERRYKVTITNNSMGDEEYILSPVVVDSSDDGSASGDKKLAQLADIELGSEKICEYQSQADYDRRALGRAMLLTDINDFFDTIPLWDAVDVRGGSSPGQKAAYLGVSKPDVISIGKRYRECKSNSGFINDRKGYVWDEMPPEFE
ncbi:MAG: hypothetical protein GY814_20375 [Gammaproteobacteria bacterium]|nr:hypothetical protein [Gammaproteobacteria bacterium]